MKCPYGHLLFQCSPHPNISGDFNRLDLHGFKTIGAAMIINRRALQSRPSASSHGTATTIFRALDTIKATIANDRNTDKK